MDQATQSKAIREIVEQLKTEQVPAHLQAVLTEVLKTLDEPIDFSLRRDRIRSLLDSAEIPNDLHVQFSQLTFLLETPPE